MTFATTAKSGTSTLLRVSLGASLLAALLLSIVATYFVTLGSDAAWYAYPGYAWAEGGDPSENIPAVGRPQPPPDRPFVQFDWENRTNLTNLITRVWYEMAPGGWLSMRLFGAVQWLILAGLLGWAAARVTGSRLGGVLVAAIVLIDARILEAAMSNARPDLFIADVAAGLMLLLLRPRMGRLTQALALLLAFSLPLLHTTAAHAIAFVIVFLAARWAIARYQSVSLPQQGFALLLVTVLIASFFARIPVLDVLVPSRVPEAVELPFRHSLMTEMRTLIEAGPVSKIVMEASRWQRYFLMANAAALLFLLFGAYGCFRALRAGGLRSGGAHSAAEGEAWRSRDAFALAAGLVAAVGTMLVFDSHEMVEHALVIAALGFLAAAAVAAEAVRRGAIRERTCQQAWTAVFSVGMALNLVHCYTWYQDYGSHGVSNPAVRQAILGALPQDGDVRIIGPAEIWPYLADRRAPTLLIDNQRAVFRHNNWKFDIDAYPDFRPATFLIINKAYYGYDGWGRAAEQWQAEGLISPLAQVGDCEISRDCYLIFSKQPR